MRDHLAAVGCVLFLASAALTQAPELKPVTAAVQRIVSDLKLDGAGIVVLRQEGDLHRSVHGTLTEDEVLPIASASKWLAVATVLTLVDEGLLDLDVPVARYVSEFDRADKSTLTLRQCLACTGGVPPRLGERMRGWDMQQFAAAAADQALRDSPGAAFRYGGAGFQIAAVAAERVTGKSWHVLFEKRIAGPLRMTHTKFGTLNPIGGEPGTAALPWVAGGAVSTLADYSLFLRMLVTKGMVGDTRILAENSVLAMWRDQVPPMVEVQPVGFESKDVRYGLGTWIEKLDGEAVRVSDPGAFGFTPWIDLDLQLGGVFAVRDRVGRLMPHLQKLQATVREVAQSPVLAGTETTVTLSHGNRNRRYVLHVPPRADEKAPAPLLLVLHGGGGNGEQAREATALAEIGTRAGFAVAFPDGTGPLRGKLLTWNSGGIPVYAVEHDVDDVGFVRAVVADIQQRIAVDVTRVFAAGHSNGGMMCHRLAREAADVFAGIAVVAGAMNFTAVDSEHPIAVLLVHGTGDAHVLYDGGAPRESTGRAGERVDASVRAAIDYYVARNGALAYPTTQQEGKVRIDTYAAGRSGEPAEAPVRVITLDGGGHSWPGSTQRARLLADTPFPFDASRAIVEFFASLQPAPRPGAPAAASPR